ncbi:MAG TPA: hypothetical protein VM618_10435, partial [Acidimicrobiia bacterium]|nr:hypothetical protein [Acidimicrobiia bacterium]
AEWRLAGGNDAPTSTAPPPPPPPAEGSYGSDPTLDRLQDRCATGDAEACTQLYWDSPLGSDYERFGEERMGASESLDGDTMMVIEAVAMQMTWDQMTASDRATACEGYNTFGPEISYGFFTAGTNGEEISFASFVTFFDEKC